MVFFSAGESLAPSSASPCVPLCEEGFPPTNFIYLPQELGDFKFSPFLAAELTFFPGDIRVSCWSISRIEHSGGLT